MAFVITLKTRLIEDYTWQQSSKEYRKELVGLSIA